MSLDHLLHARPRGATAQGDLHRQKILAAIRGNPGIHLRRLAHIVGLSWNTCLHHVGVLEARGLVVVRKVAGKVCAFDASRGAVGGKTAACLLRDPRNTSVARFVADHPGAHQRAICAGTSLAPSVVTRRLQHLEDAGLVERVREGRVALVQPTPRLGRALAGLDDDPLRVRSASPDRAGAYAVQGGPLDPSSRHGEHGPSGGHPLDGGVPDWTRHRESLAHHDWARHHEEGVPSTA